MTIIDTPKRFEGIAQTLKHIDAEVSLQFDQLAKRREKIVTTCEELSKGFLQISLEENALRYTISDSVASPSLALSQSPWSSNLRAIREQLRDAGYEHVSARINQIYAYAQKLEQINHLLDKFKGAWNALSDSERSSLHYLALGFEGTRADGQLAALLYAHDSIDDEAITRHCNYHPQALPPAPLMPVLKRHHKELSAQKLFAHINSFSPEYDSVSATSESFLVCVDALRELATEHFSWSTEEKSFSNTTDNWIWPFQKIQNNYIKDNYAIDVPNQPIRKDGMKVRYASIPSDSSRQQNSASEDSIWFTLSNRNEFIAILADGASQSAFGGIASNVLCSMLMRYTQAHPGRLVTASIFSDICRVAVCQARVEVEKQFRVLDSLQAENAMSRILRKRNAVGGSQAVFAIVQKQGNTIQCISAGNVRIVIPGHIELGSSLFSSDSARFASLPELGLIGNIHINTYTLVSDAFSITIHSDALENYSARLVTDGWLDLDTLMAAAQHDDTTYITIRYPASQ
jgi:hypothetical protein